MNTVMEISHFTKWVHDDITCSCLYCT